MNNNSIIFTVGNLAYMPKALVLAKSVLANTGQKLQIFLIDKKIEINLPFSYADFTWIEDLDIPDLNKLAFMYDITELSTSLKPTLTLKLLEDFDKVIFLDPDTCLYCSVDSILEDLNQHYLILTPHYTIPFDNSLADNNLGLMLYGPFNLGFFAVYKSSKTVEFLRWWEARCRILCFFEPQFGLSTDQKWISLAPAFFPDLHISFNLGYNVAYWNLHERFLSKTLDNKLLINNHFPLVFFHFSSFDDANPKNVTKRNFNIDRYSSNTLIDLCDAYAAEVDFFRNMIKPYKYGFDFMSNGDYISPTLRRAYSSIHEDLPVHLDPFDSSGPVGRFAKKNFLKSTGTSIYRSKSASDLDNHKFLFMVVNLFMKLLLRILGPNQFYNFSRFLIFLSSYRQNKDLWKI